MKVSVSKKHIGYRVKAAREIMKLKQDDLAKSLGLKDRQTISDIENGKRVLKPEELVRLTEILDKNIEFFIDPFSVIGEAQFSWRAANELSKQNLDEFELKVGQWIGLLRWLRDSQEDRPIDPLKYSLKLNIKSSFEDAIACAENLAKKLHLGTTPSENLIDAIEKQLDIPVLFVDTIKTPEGHTISGATCHLQDLGTILINRNETQARRYYDLAHELFHVLTWDAMRPDHRESNSMEHRTNSKRIEQLADNFAAALLMPMQCLDYHLDKNKLDDIEHLVNASIKLHVSPPALAYRLFNLKWISEDVKDELLKKHHTTPVATDIKPFSTTFIEMLHPAIDVGKLSARKAAKALDMNLPQLATLFKEHSFSVPFDM